MFLRRVDLIVVGCFLATIAPLKPDALRKPNVSLEVKKSVGIAEKWMSLRRRHSNGRPVGSPWTTRSHRPRRRRRIGGAKRQAIPRQPHRSLQIDAGGIAARSSWTY